jgi:hypothetical protein
MRMPMVFCCAGLAFSVLTCGEEAGQREGAGQPAVARLRPPSESEHTHHVHRERGAEDRGAQTDEEVGNRDGPVFWSEHEDRCLVVVLRVHGAVFADRVGADLLFRRDRRVARFLAAEDLRQEGAAARGLTFLRLPRLHLARNAIVVVLHAVAVGFILVVIRLAACGGREGRVRTTYK